VRPRLTQPAPPRVSKRSATHQGETPFGGCIAGNSGVIQGYFTYDENTQPEPRQTLVASGTLEWNQDIPILQLLPGVRSVAVVLVDLTGHMTALIGRGTNRFFSVDHTGQAMVVHSRSPQQALTSA